MLIRSSSRFKVLHAFKLASLQCEMLPSADELTSTTIYPLLRAIKNVALAFSHPAPPNAEYAPVPLLASNPNTTHLE